MSLSLALLAAVIVVAPSEARKHYPGGASRELDAPIMLGVELGTQAITDPNWNLFNGSQNTLPTRGIRAGYAFNPYVSAIGGWHHGARGAEVFVGDDEETSFASAFYGDEFMLGARGTLPVLPWLQPYATLQAAGLKSTVRFDDDPEDDDNLNQIERGAFDLGGVAAGGVELLLPMAYGDWALNTWLEMGYAHYARIEYDDLGDLQFKGFHLRWGVGARF